MDRADVFLQTVLSGGSRALAFAGCAKDGPPEGPPPKTPPPPPPPSGGERRFEEPWEGFEFGRQRRIFMVTLKQRSERFESGAKDVVREHVSYLATQRDAGNLRGAGAFRSGKGGVQFLSAQSRAEVERIIEGDPLLKAGYYKDYEIHEILPQILDDC